MASILTYMERMDAIVSGKVQGVGYRYFVRDKATRLKLVGEVENLEDRTVRVVAEGERDSLERLIVQLHRGPLFSHVEHISVSWSAGTSAFTEFRIR